MHAAIRFYSDEGRKVLIVPVTDVENFDENNYTNVPYYVKKYDANNEYHLSPAEVLSAGQKEDLANENRRYIKKKLRRSDALQKLQEAKQIEKKKNPKIIRAKLKKMSQKHNGKKEMTKFMNSRKRLNVSNDKDYDISEEQKELDTSAPGEAGLSKQTIDNNTELQIQKSVNSKEPLRFSSDNESDVDEVQKECNRSTLDKAETSKDNTDNNTELPSSTVSQKQNKQNEMQTFNSTKALRVSSDKEIDIGEIQKQCDRSSPLDKRGTSKDNVENLTQCSTPSIINGVTPVSTPRINHETPVGTPLNRTPSNVRTETSSSSDEDENVAGNEIVETPRRRRQRLRQYTIYQPRIQVQPDNLENLEDVFDNTLQAEVKEVNGEGKQLYATEGDEIYVGCNKSIQIAFWEYMKHRGPTIFLRELLEILWGKRDLVNRCFKISKASTEIQDRSPKKVYTPAKYKVLRRLYKDYLNETYGHSSKKKKILKNMNKVIGYKVRDLRRLNYVKL